MASLVNAGGATTEEWNESYVTVESYLLSLGVRNRLLLSRLILRILDRAQERLNEDSSQKAPSVAMEETISLVADWFSRAADVNLPDNRLAARGRLALLLADIPGRYQAYILAEPPLPPEVSAALKESYLRAEPLLQRRSMVPRPITLNPIMRQASEWWEGLHRAPIVKGLVVATVLALLGTAFLLFFWQ
jgi:hypothetical protein